MKFISCASVTKPKRNEEWDNNDVSDKDYADIGSERNIPSIHVAGRYLHDGLPSRSIGSCS